MPHTLELQEKVIAAVTRIPDSRLGIDEISQKTEVQTISPAMQAINEGYNLGLQKTVTILEGNLNSNRPQYSE